VDGSKAGKSEKIGRSLTDLTNYAYTYMRAIQDPTSCVHPDVHADFDLFLSPFSFFLCRHGEYPVSVNIFKIEPPLFGIVGFAVPEEVVSLDGKAPGKS
jgi:hypothetical protein